MSIIYVDWYTGMVERRYRGARTVRFVKHMNMGSLNRLLNELNDLSDKGYFPTKQGTGWLYTKGAAA